MFDKIKKAYNLISRLDKTENELDKNINTNYKSTMFDAVCFILDSFSEEERQEIFKRYSK